MPERFSASVAGRHMTCTASANLGKAIPGWAPPEEDPTADNAANRGTMIHSFFADVMSLPLADQKNFLAALEYVTEVESRRRFKKLVEVPMQAVWLATQPTTTADVVFYLKGELHVIDVKTGKIPVSAFENEQLMYYAVTYLHLAPEAKGVHLHIVQPWANHMEEWFADMNTLSSFMVRARAAEFDIQRDVLNFVPSDKCQFCPANPHGRGAKGRPLCPAMMQLLYPSEPIDESAIFDVLEEDE